MWIQSPDGQTWMNLDYLISLETWTYRPYRFRRVRKRGLTLTLCHAGGVSQGSFEFLGDDVDKILSVFESYLAQHECLHA